MPNNMRLVTVKEFLRRRFPGGIQIFNCTSLYNDIKDNIYDRDGITVDYCEYWEYLEIFGVTESEYNELCKTIGRGHMNGCYEH